MTALHDCQKLYHAACVVTTEIPIQRRGFCTGFFDFYSSLRTVPFRSRGLPAWDKSLMRTDVDLFRQLRLLARLGLCEVEHVSIFRQCSMISIHELYSDTKVIVSGPIVTSCAINDANAKGQESIIEQ